MGRTAGTVKGASSECVVRRRLRLASFLSYYVAVGYPRVNTHKHSDPDLPAFACLPLVGRSESSGIHY
jgi:hypothetical protein